LAWLQEWMEEAGERSAGRQDDAVEAVDAILAKYWQ
jgi:hypothetical protein